MKASCQDYEFFVCFPMHNFSEVLSWTVVHPLLDRLTSYSPQVGPLLGRCRVKNIPLSKCAFFGFWWSEILTLNWHFRPGDASGSFPDYVGHHSDGFGRVKLHKNFFWSKTDNWWSKPEDEFDVSHLVWFWFKCHCVGAQPIFEPSSFGLDLQVAMRQLSQQVHVSFHCSARNGSRDKIGFDQDFMSPWTGLSACAISFPRITLVTRPHVVSTWWIQGWKLLSHDETSNMHHLNIVH